VPLGFLLQTIALPAWMMLIYWVILQVAGGVTTIGAEGGGVAFWAHLGGFLAGVVLVKIFEKRDRVAAHSRSHWEPRRMSQW
jgi:membrane associated rhomboid family serine protease